MSEYAVMPLTDFKNVCDTIREKNGTTDSIKSGEVAEKINEVYEAGKQAEWSDFWDGFQANGERTDYSGSPFRKWTNAMFKPKYDMRPVGSAATMFGNTKFTDIAELLEKAGVVLDTSQATSLAEFTSYYTSVTRLPEISTIGCNSLSAFMYNSPYIHTIDKLILRDDGSQIFNANTFKPASFRNIVIEGVIGNDLPMPNPQWTVESAISFLTHLKDFSGTDEEYTRTITMNASVWELLDQDTTAPNGVTWKEYVDQKCWIY